MKASKIFMIICGIIGFILGIAYYPVYVAAWVFHKITRIVLALCYFLMFRWKMATDILKYLFEPYGRD